MSYSPKSLVEFEPQDFVSFEAQAKLTLYTQWRVYCVRSGLALITALYRRSPVYSLTPLLRRTFTTLMPVYPSHSPAAPTAPPAVFKSPSRASKNCSVSRKPSLLSCDWNISVAAYIALREARFVYQDASTLPSPARNQISSARAKSSRSDAGT